MHDPEKLPPLPVVLECMSWFRVQWLMAAAALRFGPEVSERIYEWICREDARAWLCIATLPSAPRDVMGFAHYHQSHQGLHFNYIRVRGEYRRRGIAQAIITEVVLHPTTILCPVISWTSGSDEGEALSHHLEFLRDYRQRLCGTPFTLDVKHHISWKRSTT